MVGVSLIALHESLDELSQQLQQAKTPRDKERLQVLYWLKQNNPPLISTVAKSLGKHRNTIQTWLSLDRTGGVRVIPQWADTALAKRLQEPEHGFKSYGQVAAVVSPNVGC